MTNPKLIFKALSLSAAVAASAALGFARSPSAHADPAHSQSMHDQMKDDSPQAGQADPAAAMPSDAQIAKIVMTVNKGEIDQAKYAIGKTKNPEVRKFARQMIQEHSRVNMQASKVAKQTRLTPEASDKSASLQTEAEATLAELKRKDGNELDVSYVEAQVKAHQDVLDSIDKELLPNAKAPQLRAMLEKARPRVAAHLEHAKALKSKMSEG